MTRRGLALIELLLGIIVVWFVVWLTTFISNLLDIHLLFASALIVYSYVVIAHIIGRFYKSKKSDPPNESQSTEE